MIFSFIFGHEGSKWVPGLLSTRPFSTRHISTRHQSTSDTCLPRPFSTKTLVYQGYFSTIDTSLPRLLSTQTLLYHGLLSTSDICLPDISLPSSKNRHFSTTRFFSINNKEISQLRYFEYVFLPIFIYSPYYMHLFVQLYMIESFIMLNKSNILTD